MGRRSCFFVAVVEASENMDWLNGNRIKLKYRGFYALLFFITQMTLKTEFCGTENKSLGS